MRPLVPVVALGTLAMGLGCGWVPWDREDDDGTVADPDPVDTGRPPYAGGWTKGACHDDLVATGKRVGDVDENFALLDQHGETVELYDFCDRTVHLVFVAGWDSASQSQAMGLEQQYQNAIASDVMVMTLIIEDVGQREADLADLQEWSDEFGLTMPVLSDPGGEFMWSHIEGPSVGLPYVVLLDEGVVIHTLEWATVDDAINLAEGRD